MADIRDFILDETAFAEETAKTKKRAKAQIDYETVLVSGPDFVVRRKTKNTSTLLCMMLSMNQMYIKNEKNGSIEKLTEQNLSTFLHGADQVPVRNENGETPFWLLYIDKSKAFKDAFKRVLVDEEYRQMLCKGYILLSSSSNFVPLKKFTNILGEKFIKRLFMMLTEEERLEVRYFLSRQYYYSSSEFFFSIPAPSDKICGFMELFTATGRGYRRDNPIEHMNPDNVRYMVERYFASPATSMPNTYEVMHGRYYNREKEVTRLNERKIIDHCFDSGIEQGYGDMLESFCSCWCDYLDSQQLVYGRLVDKYPLNLASSEQRVNYVAKQKEKVLEAKHFEEAAERMKAYRHKDDNYIITSPEAPVDMVEESKNMSNCLSGYVKRVADGNTMIFFLREKSNPEKAFVDIEIRQDGSLGQVLSRFNHRPPASALDFVHRWHSEHFDVNAA